MSAPALGLQNTALPAGLVPLRPRLVACRQLDRVHPELCAALGLDPELRGSVGLVTCDQDDSTYVALDHATKFANVEVSFGKSFYAGAKHGSGPYSGEILGILAAADPDEVREGLWAVKEGLRESFCFHTFAGGEDGSKPAFFAYVLAAAGRYLAPQAGIAPGESMAYLIAPPLEAIVGTDAALKAADVRLAKLLPPPSETNFGGAYLVGPQAELEAAAVAFVEAIRAVDASPLNAARRPERLRR